MSSKVTTFSSIYWKTGIILVLYLWYVESVSIQYHVLFFLYVRHMCA